MEPKVVQPLTDRCTPKLSLGTILNFEEQDLVVLPLPESLRVEFLRLLGQAQASGKVEAPGLC